MKVKLVPENKTFLYIVLALIGLLVVFQVIRMMPWRVSAERDNPAFISMQNLVAHEMDLRKRHAQLLKVEGEWHKLYLTGTPKEANLVLLKEVQQWATINRLTYDSIQMLGDQSGQAKNQAAISIQGNSSYQTVKSFLEQVENANVMVSVTGLRLKKESSTGEMRYELTIIAPLLMKERRNHD